MAPPRGARQRDLVPRRRARPRPPPPRRARRRDGGSRAARGHRARRPPAEPRRAGALSRHEPPRAGRFTRSRARVGGARRGMAGRALEPLPLRHEPRLVRPVPARDPRPAEALPGVVPARDGGPPRDGGRLDVLLRPAGEAPEPAGHARTAGLARGVRPGHRGALRRGRAGLLPARGLRLLLPRLRRDVAAHPGLDRDDVRAGLGARPRLPARGRHRAHLPRRHPQPLPGRPRHGRDRRARAREAAARLPRVPALRGQRGGARGGAAVRDRARGRPGAPRAAGGAPRRAGDRGARGRGGGPGRDAELPRGVDRGAAGAARAAGSCGTSWTRRSRWTRRS